MELFIFTFDGLRFGVFLRSRFRVVYPTLNMSAYENPVGARPGENDFCAIDILRSMQFIRTLSGQLVTATVLCGGAQYAGTNSLIRSINIAT